MIGDCLQLLVIPHIALFQKLSSQFYGTVPEKVYVLQEEIWYLWVKMRVKNGYRIESPTTIVGTYPLVI